MNNQVDVMTCDGPRQCRPDELPALITLLDHVFRADGASSMGTEFPVFLSRDHCEGLWIVKDGGKVVAHVGIDYPTIDIEGATVRVGMIGAVATDENYRGGGLASRLLDAVEADARQRGTGFFMISGGRRLYTRRGAKPAGAIPQFRVPPAAINAWRAPSVKWRPATPVDVPDILRWYEVQNPRFSRDEADIARVVTAECCGQHTCIAMENATPVGYAVFTIGRDALHVLETGGNELCAAALGNLAPDGYEGKLIVSLTCQHPFTTVVQRRIRDTPGAETIAATFGGTAQWADFAACVEQLKPYWQKRGVPGMTGRTAAEGLVLTDGTDLLALQPPAMVEAFFGAPQAQPVALPDRWRGAFPVPLRMYGLNYI